jgi:glutamate dehydrogenase
VTKPAKPAEAPATPDKEHVRTLTDRICQSLLPGDVEFARPKVREAAEFLLSAAAERRPGRPIVRIDSVTDERRFMRIALINDDMPFLVNSLAAAIAEQGLSIDRLVHPIVSVQRTEDDALQSLQGKLNSDMLRESMIYIETTRVDAKARRALEKALRETLDDVRAAVKDWTRLQEVMRADADRIADEEDAELLRWLDGGMLTQLGHVTRHRDGTTHNALGICRKSAKDILADASYERAFEWFADPANRDEELLIIKANRLSKVHRRVPLDLFIVPIRDEGRRVTSLSLHAGVWTSAALNAPPRTVPRLRREVEALLEQFDFEQTGHAGKALIHAFTALPHDLLIGFERADLARIVSALMSLVDRPRPRLTLVEAPLARHLFAFVWIPRDMLSTRVRRQIEAMIEQETGATRLDWSLEVEGGNLAMIRFVLDKRESQTDVDEAAIERRLQTMLRGWSEAVENELANYFEPGRAAALSTRFARGFPAGYRMEYGPAEGARDIARLWELQPSEPEDAQRRDARLYRRGDDPSSDIRLKIYQASGNLPLSDAVPVLENFGFTVQTEIPTTLKGKQAGTIHDFLVELPEGTASGVALERAAAIELAIATVLNGDAENDPFNRLAVETGLTEDQANLLRAFYRYLRQTGMSFTIYTCVDALRCAPQVTRGLIDLFEARHDPGFSGSREDAVETARARVREGLSGVGAINDDRLLRLYLALVEAIVRTNLYTPACRQALALKIVSEQVPNLPKPLPWREIFVYSRRVEGIHLRAGPVARGGLRWSDRRDDFRTEVLGLMKAQRVKNAVIVPTGAKGGFYPKQLPNPATHRDGWAAEGQASYEVFIRALLSITDNIVDDEVVHPKGVVIHDGDDPYFVVAADKGTARFSDVANAIALEQNFWLGDAFASGGSNGYDHKAMGITARGAWISVQRHFREMGIDVQSDTITVAGCGDMSGDVFGNGMLLSKAIKLVAAFDHRHIFIDPDPDPEASWRERRRLFDAPRSSWDDYDRAVLSRGGGIFARTEKSITIGKRAAAALGIEATTLDPDALIRAVLKAPVDLMWFGGIGTYVKSSRESDALVGDPGNDAVRIDGEDMRARVVGEGANLAVTQSGRIEFALCGGRINTDFIDNSAGVDCSDNEVNIKIALAAARRAGKLAEQRRKALLEEMTEEVAAIVLEDNRDQTLALSIAELGGAGAVHSQLHVIEAFEHRGALDRQTEGLADNDTLKRRAQDGIGLTRPELAVILSTSKLTLQDAIERSRLLKDGSLEPILIGAFPATMQDKFRTQICNHRLRGELIATKLANRVVNRLGLVHPFELAEEEGVTYDQVAAAYVVVERLFGIDAMWEEFEAADVSETARLATLDRIASALRGHMADLLRVAPALTAPSEWLEKLHSNVETLDRAAAQMLSSQAIAQSEEISSTLIELGASEEMARKTAHLFELDGIIGLAQLADETDIEICDLAAAFIRLGSELSLDWAQSTAAVMSPSDVWERLLVSGLARDFQQMRRQFLKRLSRRKGAREEIAPAVDDWLAANETAVAQFSSMIARARREGGVTAAMLAQIASMARQLLSR